MRVFQKRMLSGRPSRSRGPGSSSRKKSASWASKECRPFGTIRTGWLLEEEPEAGEVLEPVVEPRGEQRSGLTARTGRARSSSQAEAAGWLAVFSARK